MVTIVVCCLASAERAKNLATHDLRRGLQHPGVGRTAGRRKRGYRGPRADGDPRRSASTTHLHGSMRGLRVLYPYIFGNKKARTRTLTAPHLYGPLCRTKARVPTGTGPYRCGPCLGPVLFSTGPYGCGPVPACMGPVRVRVGSAFGPQSAAVPEHLARPVHPSTCT